MNCVRFCTARKYFAQHLDMRQIASGELHGNGWSGNVRGLVRGLRRGLGHAMWRGASRIGAVPRNATRLMQLMNSITVRRACGERGGTGVDGL